MNFRTFIATALCFIFSQQIYVLENYNDYNFLGIQGGITIFNIQIYDFVTEQKIGFIAGITKRVSFRNNFDLVYGISFESVTIWIGGK